jgi:hypothetical protein
MQPSLESRISTLRGQVRRLLALHGLSWVVGLLVPIVIVLGLADWLIHLDPAVRMLELIALGVFGAWIVFRYVLSPLFVRFADLDIALRIEERWPGLNDRLASTIQFLKLGADEDRFGSQAMREATIRQTLDETKSVDFREVLERKPLHQALGLAAGAVAVALVFVAAAPGLSETALRRLFLPFGPDQWPQQTHLSLLDRETPRKVARGEPFTLAVAVGEGESVPNSAKATYRFDDGETATESLRAVEGGIFRGRIEAVDRPFRFSVVAGDDSTSIRDIEVKVVPPPALKDLSIRLIAPAYTGKGPETLAPGLTQVRALEGTVIELTALANKPIERAALHLGEASASEGVAFDSTRTKLSTKFTVGESVPFFFELHDTEGFRNREATRYEIRSSRDEAPRVVIDEPANDRDVPANATVPVRFAVDDDYGIHSARLIYKVASGGSEPTKDEALVLWEAKGNAEAGPVKHQEVPYDWNLAPMKLAPGSIITFHADARDFDDLKGPNLGKSRELRLRIVSDEDAARELDDQRREIREETARIKAMQDQAMLPVDDASRTLARTDKLPQNERENLKNAEMIQRQVSSRINSRTDGLDHKIRRFLEDLKNFKVSNPDAQKQMEQMQAGVEQIRQKNLEPAEQGLTHASKNLDGAEPSRPDGAQPDVKPEAANAQTRDQAKGGQASTKGSPNEKSKASDAAKNGDPSQPKGGEPKNGKADPQEPKNEPRKPALDAAKEGLAEAKTNQKAISDELQKMLDSLSEFETYRGVVKDAQNLLKEQEQSMKQAAEAAAKDDLMGKTPDALTPEQKADLANLAARQQNVARGLQGLQERMDEMARRLDESDPLAGSAMRGAAEESRKKQTSAKMGEAADQLEKNRMGEARNSQEQARQDLKELVDSIQNRRERELARLVKELKNAEKDLQNLRDRQAQNLKKTREAQKNPDAKQRAEQLQKLAKEQAEIQKELDKQLKRLAKLNAESAARAGAKAASKMGKAQQDLDQDQGEQAGKEEEDALADLDDAQDEVKQARKDAEEQLAMEQLAKMGDQLKSIAERQDNVVTRTGEYEKLRAEHEGKLTFPQQRGVRNLGDVQAGIKDETGQLAEKLDGAPVFALTLKRAGDGMETAAQRLQALKTDEETKRAAASAARRFKQLIDALKADQGKEGGQKPPGGGNEGGGAGGSGGGGDGIPAAAQVKMLKALQEEINDRTEFFDEQKRRGKTLTPEQEAEIERLQTDQGTLADLVRDLTKPKKADGEE